MASIFTYDPTPPRVSSPWLRPSASAPSITELGDMNESDGLEGPKITLLADCGITKLEAEPQDGPTEYKLHLLLRPRRSFSALSTVNKISGSVQVHPKAAAVEISKQSRSQPSPSTPPSLITRQNRLQHLTTQLLWRLQQSSPYHSSSAADLVIPSLPGTTSKPGLLPERSSLLPGLEESEGALYEIGVSDDGTFVGLTKDEMDESLVNLRAMAASLGCEVKVLRKVVVGDCEWTERSSNPSQVGTRLEKLWVAEALVVPGVRRHDKSHEDTFNVQSEIGCPSDHPQGQCHVPFQPRTRTEQLRVSLTGSTTSGKSTLLGTLSTSTLDNGRGKSRLSLLKHRHEIISGVTSSVAPEIFGYSKQTANHDAQHVVNYSSGNVSSWTDIHNEADGGRLVVVVDSAGHPRYRRTAVRSLLSWVPHWTLCCIAADDDEETSGRVGATLKSQEILGLASADVDLSNAHLELCLRLDIPLVVIITKLDIASKGGLRLTLDKVLSSLKAHGRKPLMLPAGNHCNVLQAESELNMISNTVREGVESMMESNVERSPYDLVPIIFTSALKGQGISTVHALLHQLPIPKLSVPEATVPEDVSGQHEMVFHIDEVFQRGMTTQEPNYVLGGILRRGCLCLGDEVLLGPFALETADDDNGPSEKIRSSSCPGQTVGKMDLGNRESPPIVGRMTLGKESTLVSPWPEDTWRVVRIVSLRNLRLAVRRLECDQVGTVGIAFIAPPMRSLVPRIRRGMVFLPAKGRHPPLPPAYAGFTALFDHAQVSRLSINTSVIAYTASIRAPAKIVRAEIMSPDPETGVAEELSGEGTMWAFDESGSDEGGVDLPPRSKETSPREIAVTLRFVTYREWVEIGTKVLIMPEGGEKGEKGSLGLEGYVGRIVEGFV